MESARGPARVYQHFEPSMEWVPEDDSDTLLVYLPSFAKEQLRVQLRARNLIISGERKLQQQNNNNTWSRFRVEFPVSVNCDINKISAKFEGNILFVRQPKLKMNMIIPTTTTSSSSAAAAADQKPPPPPLVDDHESLHHHHKTAADIEDDQLAAKMGLEKTGHQLAQPKLLLDTSSPSNKTTTTDNHDHHPLLEEEAVNDNAPDAALVDKQKTNTWDNKHKADAKTTKTAFDDEVGRGRVFSTKASSSCRNAVNTIVILLLGLVIGIYVSNSWPTKLTSPTVDVLP